MISFSDPTFNNEGFNATYAEKNWGLCGTKW